MKNYFLDKIAFVERAFQQTYFDNWYPMSSVCGKQGGFYFFCCNLMEQEVEIDRTLPNVFCADALAVLSSAPVLQQIRERRSQEQDIWIFRNSRTTKKGMLLTLEMFSAPWHTLGWLHSSRAPITSPKIPPRTSRRTKWGHWVLLLGHSTAGFHDNPARV